MPAEEVTVLTDTVMKAMGVAKTLTDSYDRINSLDFHRTEDLLVTGSDDDSIRVYNTSNAQAELKLPSKKYGVCHVRYTHNPNCVVYSTPEHKVTNFSDPAWFSLRRHDLQANQYDRYFKGHTDLVLSIATCGATDAFLSTALDSTLRLWDWRATICQGLLHIPDTSPMATFDPQGQVFAVAANDRVVKLYDMRACGRGPFMSTPLPYDKDASTEYRLNKLEFSPNGAYILAATYGRVHVLDAYKGKLLFSFGTAPSHSGTQESNAPLEASFSPDSRYIAAACEDRSILLWSVEGNRRVERMDNNPHAYTPCCVAWQPGQLLLATACNQVNLWTPDTRVIEKATPAA